MPLPSSPRSQSTATPSYSEESDDSLTTPRPGPSNPADRTPSNLSRPAIPAYPDSGQEGEGRAIEEGAGEPSTSDRQEGGAEQGQTKKATEQGDLKSATDALVQGASSLRRSAGETRQAVVSASGGQDSHRDTQTEGKDARERLDTTERARVRSSESDDHTPSSSFGRKSVSFHLPSSDPKLGRQSSYSSAFRNMGRQATPDVSPTRKRSSMDGEEVEHGDDSSADENTAIFKRGIGSSRSAGGYGSVVADEGTASPSGHEGETEDGGPSDLRRRRSNGSTKAGVGRKPSKSNPAPEEAAEAESEGWLRRMMDKYGSVELENKGSVARDHLALERTFLAWLRTSLSFASIGIAVTQLFRLNTALEDGKSSSVTSSYDPSQDVGALKNSTPPPGIDRETLSHVGKPLGATFIGISIVILLIGFHRYFESQHYVIRGKFPASRGSIFLVTLMTCALIVTSLVIVVTVARGAIDT